MSTIISETGNILDNRNDFGMMRRQNNSEKNGKRMVKNNRVTSESNAGFSMVELVIVIAIMAIITAVAAPTYLHYVRQNRTTTCKTNREALMGIYERCVIYDKTKQLSTADLIYVCEGTEPRVAGEVVEFNKCPADGTYTYEVTGDTAVITCSHSEHTEAVRTSFVGWTGTAVTESDDNPISPP